MIDGYSRDSPTGVSCCRRVCRSVFLLPHLSVYVTRSVSRVGKYNSEKKRERKRKRWKRHCSFHGEARINLSGVRGPRPQIMEIPEKRANKRARDETTNPFKSFLQARLRYSRRHCLLNGVAYDGGCHRTSELALRSLVRFASRHLLFSFPALGAVFFTGYCLEHHFSRTPQRARSRTMSDVRASTCAHVGATITLFPYDTRDSQRQVLRSFQRVASIIASGVYTLPCSK